MEDNKECSMHLFENVQQSRLLRNFFEQRLQFILDNKYPAMLTSDPACRFVMYLIPQKFQETQLDITKLDDQKYLVPIGEDENTIISDFNYDGILFLSSVHLKHSYIQVFRDGKMETVVAIARSSSDSRDNVVHILKFQKSLPIHLSQQLRLLHDNKVPGPYNLYFRILFAEGLRVDSRDIAKAGYDVKGRNKALIRNNIDLPIYRFEHAHVDLNACLKSFFDIIWNTFGFKEAPDLDKLI